MLSVHWECVANKRVLLSKGHCYPNSYTLRARRTDPCFENELLLTGITIIRVAINWVRLYIIDGVRLERRSLIRIMSFYIGRNTEYREKPVFN